ncbi:MAG: hypothetical protein KDD25_10335 [Bdellovibrionales bacterium]|nr:hypothetical protein [Bdellovibrionales bacterium]
MKTKTYKYGKITFKTYLKKVGHSYECGLVFSGKPVFLGNFVHSAYATKWWGVMNQEIRKFSTKFCTSGTVSKTWYTNFLSHHVNVAYFNFLDKILGKYNRAAVSAVSKNSTKYRRLKRNWATTDRVHLKVTAA